MNVNDIRERIIEISHDEAAPDTDLRAKALRWLNSAYHEIMEEALPWLGNSLQQEESLVSNSSGVATLSEVPYRLLALVDVTNGRTLTEKTREEILALTPAEDVTGVPRYFYRNGAALNLYPQAAVTLKVVYLPVVADLVEGGAENTVLLPTPFHSALVWGGLVWSATYERGFNTQGELTLFQTKWEEAKRNLKLALANKPTGPGRTEPYTYV